MRPERIAKLPGFPGQMVSDAGIVYSKRTGKPLKTWLTNGYPSVSLYRDGRCKRIKVHRLVLLSFAGPPPVGAVARHLNCNKTDNRVENLAWGTYKENMADSIRHGKNATMETHSNTKLTRTKATEIRELHRSGISARALARSYGVHFSTINALLHGETWRFKP